MAIYKVRDHFHVHLDGKSHGPGTELDLSKEQAERYAVQVELVINKPKSRAKDAACAL